MRKLIFLIIGLVILGYIGYKYFDLDTNSGFQNAIKTKDYKSAIAITKNAIGNTAEKQAVAYFKEHNGYFVSKTNNICNTAKSLFAGIGDASSSPIECVALEHTFTARLKSTLLKTSFCADQTGFYTRDIADETGFREGLNCQ